MLKEGATSGVRRQHTLRTSLEAAGAFGCRRDEHVLLGPVPCRMSVLSAIGATLQMDETQCFLVRALENTSGLPARLCSCGQAGNRNFKLRRSRVAASVVPLPIMEACGAGRLCGGSTTVTTGKATSHT